MADEATGKALVKCTGAIAKAGAKFASKKQKSLEKCVDRLFVCTQSKLGDPGCGGSAAEACAKEFAKISTEEGKLGATITKACPAALYVTLRDVLGANLDVRRRAVQPLECRASAPMWGSTRNAWCGAISARWKS